MARLLADQNTPVVDAPLSSFGPHLPPIAALPRCVKLSRADKLKLVANG
jgi:hypothetical protein